MSVVQASRVRNTPFPPHNNFKDASTCLRTHIFSKLPNYLFIVIIQSNKNFQNLIDNVLYIGAPCKVQPTNNDCHIEYGKSEADDYTLYFLYLIICNYYNSNTNFLLNVWTGDAYAWNKLPYYTNNITNNPIFKIISNININCNYAKFTSAKIKIVVDSPQSYIAAYTTDLLQDNTSTFAPLFATSVDDTHIHEIGKKEM
jgi:hypothetical protein